MSRPPHVLDCSRATLQRMEETLSALVAAGDAQYQERLDQVRAAIPDAPDYDIDHRDRECRRHD